MCGMSTTSRRPGDLLLDKWMPNATPEERERAHDHLRRFAKALLRIAMREVTLEQGNDSTQSQADDRILAPEII